MSGFNRVILMGNLTHDPELRYTPQGTAVVDLRMAVTTVRSGGRGGEKKEDTLFIDVTVWDRMAENCSEYLAKGRPVLVEGRLSSDSWDDKETGQKRYKTRVIANTVQFLGGGRDGGGNSGGGASRSREGAQGGGGNSGGAPRGGGRQPARPQQQKNEPFRDDFDGDDIPF